MERAGRSELRYICTILGEKIDEEMQGKGECTLSLLDICRDPAVSHCCRTRGQMEYVIEGVREFMSVFVRQKNISVCILDADTYTVSVQQ